MLPLLFRFCVLGVVCARTIDAGELWILAGISNFAEKNSDVLIHKPIVLCISSISSSPPSSPYANMRHLPLFYMRRLLSALRPTPVSNQP